MKLDIEKLKVVHQIISDTTIAPEDYHDFKKEIGDIKPSINLCIFSFYFSKGFDSVDGMVVKAVTFLKKNEETIWRRVEVSIDIDKNGNLTPEMEVPDDFSEFSTKIENQITATVESMLKSLYDYFLKKNVGNMKGLTWWEKLKDKSNGAFTRGFSLTFVSDGVFDAGLFLMNSWAATRQISTAATMVDKLRRNDRINENTLGLTQETLAEMKIPTQDGLTIQDIKLDGAFRISYTQP